MPFASDLRHIPVSNMLLGPCRGRGRRIAQFLPILGALLAAGCGGGGGSGEAKAPEPSLVREGQALFGKPAPAVGPDGSVQPGVAAGGAWVIVLAAFRDENRGAQAAMALNDAKAIYGLPQAYAEVRGLNTVVAYGAFADPSSPEAHAELERVRGIQSPEGRPFAGAFLAPPFTVQVGSRPEYNLTAAKAAHGDEALYSLQVAAYGRDDLARPTEADLKEVRKAAEEAAAVLRREGEMAFYYHGPHRSMVTIGVFDEADFDPQTPSYQSRRLMETRKRFPDNLYNGAKIRVRRPGESPRIQASTLVSIPER